MLLHFGWWDCDSLSMKVSVVDDTIVSIVDSIVVAVVVVVDLAVLNVVWCDEWSFVCFECWPCAFEVLLVGMKEATSVVRNKAC